MGVRPYICKRCLTDSHVGASPTSAPCFAFFGLFLAAVVPPSSSQEGVFLFPERDLPLAKKDAILSISSFFFASVFAVTPISNNMNFASSLVSNSFKMSFGSIEVIMTPTRSFHVKRECSLVMLL